MLSILFLSLCPIVLCTTDIENNYFNCTPGSRDTKCGHGICDFNGTSCICDYGFINEIGIEQFDIKCSYKQKSRLTACLLQSIPIPGLFGAGYFYIGRLDIGLFTLLLCWIFELAIILLTTQCSCYICSHCFRCIPRNKSLEYACERYKRFYISYFVIWFIATCVPWIYGIINICSEWNTDANNQPFIT